MSASFCDREAVVSLLLSRGANLELQDDDGETALHLAVGRGYAGVAALMCAAPGAPFALTFRNDENETPLDLAIRNGHAACEALLRAHGAKL